PVAGAHPRAAAPAHTGGLRRAVQRCAAHRTVRALRARGRQRAGGNESSPARRGEPGAGGFRPGHRGRAAGVPAHLTRYGTRGTPFSTTFGRPPSHESTPYLRRSDNSVSLAAKPRACWSNSWRACTKLNRARRFSVLRKNSTAPTLDSVKKSSETRKRFGPPYSARSQRGTVPPEKSCPDRSNRRSRFDRPPGWTGSPNRLFVHRAVEGESSKKRCADC